HLCEVLFLLGASVLIVKSLFSARPLTFDSILGTVCGYLFLGLAWAVLYSMIEGFRPGSFEISPKLVTSGEVARPLPDVLTYYSVVTLTTVGYGDISPVSPAARTVAWIRQAHQDGGTPRPSHREDEGLGRHAEHGTLDQRRDGPRSCGLCLRPEHFVRLR